MIDEILLSPPFSIRAPHLPDLHAVNDLIRACEAADDGEAESEEDDVAAQWQRSTFDLSQDAWVIEAEDGTVAGYGCLWQRGSFQAEGWVRPQVRGRGLGRALVRLSERRAREMAGGRAATIDNIVSHANGAARRLLETEGYRPERYYWRMQIDMCSRPQALPLPEGIAVRSFLPGQDDREVHSLVEAAFADNADFTPVSFEDWSNFMTRRESFDPSLFFLAIAGEQIVGAVLCPWYEETGWVRQVAVRRDRRGQGIAKALLVHAFATLYDRGQRRVALVVDSYNRTGARQAYESIGMRIVRQHDMYRKNLSQL